MQSDIIKIGCNTFHKFIENYQNFHFDGPTEFNSCNIGKIGVGINKGPFMQIKNFINVFTKIDQNIHWKDVVVIDPYLYNNTAITINQCNIENKTHTIDNNSYSGFNVSVNITNNLDYDISTIILVDMADKPLFNIIPKVSFLKGFISNENRYNCGYALLDIPKKQNVNETIKCIFPEGDFFRREYDITVVFGPFFDVGRSNLLAKKYFYDERFKKNILPSYDVNQTVLRSIRNFWYNAPLRQHFRKSKSIKYHIYYLNT